MTVTTKERFDQYEAAGKAQRGPNGEERDAEPHVEPLPTDRVADVKAVRVEWAWAQRFPFGKLVIVDGDPGLGKSALTVDVIARWTRGESQPGEDKGRDPFNVVGLAAEDGVADTIKPRLELAGADLERVFVVRGLPTFPAQLERLKATVKEKAARAVILDPGLAFVDPELNMHSDPEARRMVAGLAEVATETGAVAVFVRHLNKVASNQAMYRGGASIAIIATARAAFMVAPAPNDPGRRVFACTKANLCAMPPSLLYRVVADGPDDPPRIQWEGETTVTANEALAAMNAQRRDAVGKRDAAIDLLQDLLKGGPRPVEEIERAIRAAGIDTSEHATDSRAVRAAKKKLGIEAVKTGWREWSWRLREHVHEDGHEDGHEAEK